jgi:hypothetical protein
MRGLCTEAFLSQPPFGHDGGLGGAASVPAVTIGGRKCCRPDRTGQLGEAPEAVLGGSPSI